MIAFAIFVGLFLASAIHGLYTRRGSGINQRPYGNPYTNAPGARGASTLSHDRSAAGRYTKRARQR